MEPHRNDDAIVDVLDVLLRDGAIVRADVIVTVADVPLVGIKLSAAIAGMETMTEYGLFEEWDARRRVEAVERRQYRVHDDRESETVPVEGESVATEGNERGTEGSDEESPRASADRSEEQ